MSQESEETVNDEMKPEYDFSGGARGKYYEAYMQSFLDQALRWLLYWHYIWLSPFQNI